MSSEQLSTTTGNNDHSEQHCKYLMEVVYKGASWYTVFGTDLTGNETDNLLVNRSGKWLLFSDRAEVFKTILNADYFFDIATLHAWARESNKIENPYAVINLDVLSMRDIHATQTAVLEDLYYAIGIVEDYAVQVNNRELINLLRTDIIRVYNDVFADYFLWSPSTALDFTTLPEALSDTVNAMYRLLEGSITIDSL